MQHPDVTFLFWNVNKNRQLIVQCPDAQKADPSVCRLSPDRVEVWRMGNVFPSITRQREVTQIRCVLWFVQVGPA